MSKAGIVQYLSFDDFVDNMRGKDYTIGMLRAIYDDIFELSEEIDEPIEFNDYYISNEYYVADMVYAETEEEYNRLIEDDNYILYKEGYNYFIDMRDLTKYYRIIYAEGDKLLWKEA